MTMDIGQMPRYIFVDDYNNENNIIRRPYHHARREGRVRVKNRRMERKSVEERSETKTKVSSPRTPKVVKSLVSGGVNFGDRSNAANKSYSSFPNNRSNEHVVIDTISQQNTKPANKNVVTPTPETKTSLSFLSSIGACGGVGKIISAFQNEHNDEISFTYRLKDCHALASRRHLHDEANEKEKYDIISQLSDAPTLSRARTCTTSNTTVPSSMIIDTGDNSVTVGSIGTGGSSSKGVTLNSNHGPPKSPFSNAKKLFFGGGSGDVDGKFDEKTACSTPTRTKESLSINCNKSSNMLCNKKNNPCLTSNEVVTRQWCNKPSPISLVSSSSISKSLGSPDRTLYTTAYGDEDGIRSHPEVNCCYHEEFIGCENGETATGQSLLFQSADSGTSHSSSVDHTHEIQYWRHRLHYATKYYGKTHSSTADAYFNLGRAQLNRNQDNVDCTSNGLGNTPRSRDAARKRNRYDQAIENLTIAKGIWELTHGSEDVAVGRALDSLALAIVRRANHDRSNNYDSNNRNRESRLAAAVDDLWYARRLLEQAFAIRVYHLGVWHVDTVETYNKLAGVLLHLGRYRDASKAYREVFLVRRAIFGTHHPSVAIAAHSLANCRYKMGAIKESLEWYRISLDIYETMGLSYRHPAITNLLRDQSRLEQYM